MVPHREGSVSTRSVSRGRRLNGPYAVGWDPTQDRHPEGPQAPGEFPGGPAQPHWLFPLTGGPCSAFSCSWRRSAGCEGGFAPECTSPPRSGPGGGKCGAWDGTGGKGWPLAALVGPAPGWKEAPGRTVPSGCSGKAGLLPGRLWETERVLCPACRQQPAGAGDPAARGEAPRPCLFLSGFLASWWRRPLSWGRALGRTSGSLPDTGWPSPSRTLAAPQGRCHRPAQAPRRPRATCWFWARTPIPSAGRRVQGWALTAVDPAAGAPARHVAEVSSHGRQQEPLQTRTFCTEKRLARLSCSSVAGQADRGGVSQPRTRLSLTLKVTRITTAESCTAQTQHRGRRQTHAGEKGKHSASPGV